MVYGEYRVLAQHAHGNGGLRVWVEHIPTGERSFRILTVR